MCVCRSNKYTYCTKFSNKKFFFQHFIHVSSSIEKAIDSRSKTTNIQLDQMNYVIRKISIRLFDFLKPTLI
ncbi:hypothetical protein BpHYR1_037106 [Brachionus plicatilis]|uniref:Uncharacterized protein n=1 Tax=Brachionus plicatilis TaxID=10195 RepID=A0A3M7SST5_BRAPC|nr:hypothetical protein BpHYR1_037106 [Brachionus plicatilis]